jgi:hypothetical protein
MSKKQDMEEVDMLMSVKKETVEIKKSFVHMKEHHITCKTFFEIE